MNGPVGFYGKLPSAGDFVQRQLPAAFVDVWDRHFQRALVTGRSELGEQWSTAWTRGAAWRFVLAPEVCGDSAWCGLTGPAVDRMGRGFPMVLAAPCRGDIGGILRNGAWFDSLERIYLAARHEAASVESFAAQVSSLQRPSAEATDPASDWQGFDWEGEEWQLSLPDGVAAGIALAEAWRQSSMRRGAWCLWWTRGAARVLATRGLPRSYASLLVPLPADFDSASPATAGPAVPPVAGRADYALQYLNDGHTLLLSADDGPQDPRRRAAHRIREAALASEPELSSLRVSLTALHPLLRNARHHPFEPVLEEGAALAACFQAGEVRLLRIGAAAAWHWRHGQLRPLFVERAAGAGGEFDDLLFGSAWLTMPGLGTAGEPDCDEARAELEDGDRLLLLATRSLAQLPRHLCAEALSLATVRDARTHLAAGAGLGEDPARWPLAVVEIGV
jgi:type VI secretion system protein ImpM